MPQNYSYKHFKEINSTHKFAIENSANLDDRTIITADCQTEGCGRFGRTWLSPKSKSLLTTILLKPKITPTQASLLTPIISTAICETLIKMNILAKIKWPNDIIVDNKKICGVLANAQLDNKNLTSIAASFGLNCLQNQKELETIDRPATSVFIETNIEHDKSDILENIINKFENLYQNFLNEGFAPIFPKWRSYQSLAGKEVMLDLGKTCVKGSVADFNDSGKIVIQTQNGKKVFNSGEIIKIH